MIFRSIIPWQIKIILKIVLSCIPVNYGVWRHFLFKHGDMETPSYAYNIFQRHFNKVSISTKNEKIVTLELGSGDSLFSAMISYTFGASRTYLIDIDYFASSEMKIYSRMARYLRTKGLPFPSMKNITSIDDLLELCKAKYLVSGISSLRTIPDQSVDFIWSEAVLEHVRLSDFSAVLYELRRILKPDGICSHRIDLRDHIGGGLNNLGFSERIWESDLMAKSGFYTNRIRYSQMLNIFKQTGFHVEATIIETWDKLPVSKSKLSPDFIDLSDEDLCVSVFDVLLKPK